MSIPVEQLAVNTIKALAMDTVQKANSGHPGMPMGMADLAVVLWSKFLVVDPDDPTWIDRDRFVLSNGHGSTLLYSLLHLSGFPLTIDDLKSFRQWGSKTPGHPERDPELGIDMTTGPLGQGFGTAIGMAIAEEHLRATFGESLVNHRTFAFVSDGDLMEGISAEAASLAGHLGLGKLTYFYDDNDISIDGSTDITFTEDVAGRFAAVGWHTLEIDGHDRGAIEEATRESLAISDHPSLIIAHTHIAHGAPTMQDTSASHGSPLGEEEIRATKEAMGWPSEEAFHVPSEVYEFFSESMGRGRKVHSAWNDRSATTLESEPELARRWRAQFGSDPISLDNPGFEIGSSLATRSSSGKLFDQIAEKVPGFIGGAADLVASTKTHISTSSPFSRRDRTGRNIDFGIREHGMAAIVNGMAVHGGLRPYGSTFLVFSDYMRPAIRLGALMDAPSIWVFTHDSVFLGEDGPTHQPIEHLASLRAIPRLWVIRPADATETIEAWEVALNRREGPTALVLTRQNVPTLDRERGGVERGAYVLRVGSDAVLVATGSEVATALEAADLLAQTGTSVGVVSMPCWEAFEQQDDEYRRRVFPDGLPVVSLEAASTFGWESFADRSIGLDSFGASAPDTVLADLYGIVPTRVVEVVRELLATE
jgi:transketolase